MKQLDKYSDNRAVFVTEQNYIVSNLNVYFTKSKCVYQTNQSGVSSLSDVFNAIEEQEILLYVSTDTEEPLAVAQKVCQELNAHHIKYMFETNGRLTAQVFLISF